jgi:hypothetical protein
MGKYRVLVRKPVGKQLSVEEMTVLKSILKNWVGGGGGEQALD